MTDWMRAALTWPALLVVLLVCFRLARAKRLGARSWGLFSLALVSYAWARTLWSVDDQFIFPNHVPFPSLPDIFFVLQYPFLLLAVFFLPGGPLNCSRLKLMLDSLLMLGAGIALSSYFLLVPLYLQSQLSTTGKLIILGYPIADLVLLFGLSVTFLYRQGHQVRASLVLLIVGFLCLFIADSGVAWLLLYHISFQAGSPPDFFWMAFYLLLPLAGLVWLRCPETVAAPAGAGQARGHFIMRPQRGDIEQALRFLSPLAAALLASAMIGVQAIISPVRLVHPLVPVLMIFGLLLVVLIRQGLAVLEQAQVQREREEAHEREQAAQANERILREANRQLETFLGMASHELKTPLTSIGMGLQMIQRRLARLVGSLPEAAENGLPQAEAVQALAETTRQQGERLNRLVNDLLDTSRIQAGRLDLQRKQVDLAVIVRRAVEEQRQAAPERNILLHLPPKGPISACADAERIGQVVTNFLTNALKYSDEEQPVEVGMQEDGQHGCVWVRDHGLGIPQDEQELIWERFYRARGIEVQSGSGIGLGLGLHISKTIIEQHGGKVGVQSSPGHGSTFWFTLPLFLGPPCPGHDALAD
ncbi:MAG TPA: HAMP domain-containing sensor histidine kinase [Ktedonobacterales bacterium]|nr:HAMP domain-containing sensor histidine kinase [Ktedonobacterales bacterium]